MDAAADVEAGMGGGVVLFRGVPSVTGCAGWSVCTSRSVALAVAD